MGRAARPGCDTAAGGSPVTVYLLFEKWDGDSGEVLMVYSNRMAAAAHKSACEANQGCGARPFWKIEWEIEAHQVAATYSGVVYPLRGG